MDLMFSGPFCLGFGVIIIVLMYMIVKMIWNRLNGRDELDGLFPSKNKKNR